MSEPAKQATILIVDDEPDVNFFISKACQPEGYTTISAGSGQEALKYIEELGDRIDLVLLDLRMPGMGGLEVLKTIRKKHDKLPVNVLTALPEKQEECEKLGIEAFMTKPYSLEELYHHITAVIDRRKDEKTVATLPKGQMPCAKVLIVDDEKEVCELVAECLKDEKPAADYEVRYVTSGDEALRIADEFEPDLAIIDIKMPHMWGDELIAKFKNGDAHCPKDFIIFTAADVPEQRLKARQAGHTYLTKPSEFEKLTSAMTKICVRHNLLKKMKS